MPNRIPTRMLPTGIPSKLRVIIHGESLAPAKQLLRAGFAPDSVPASPSPDPTMAVILCNEPVLLLTAEPDSQQIKFCRWLLQARHHAVVTLPCSEEDLHEAHARLHWDDITMLLDRVRSAQYDVPEVVLQGDLPLESLMSEADLAQLRADPALTKISFNVWRYTVDELLVIAALLLERGLQRLGVAVPPFSRLLYFCGVLRAVYGFRGYHSFRHIIDVSQYCCFLDSSGVCYPGTATPIGGLHGGSLCVAALGHDLLHPGFSTQTVREISPAWAAKYPTLEAFHAKVYDRLLHELQPQLYDAKGSPELMAELILATDMARHNGLMQIPLELDERGICTFLCFLLKLADIGNASRVFETSVRQTMCIGVEVLTERVLRTQLGLEMLPHIRVFAALPMPETRQEAWQRLQKNQKGFVMNFLVPTLGKLFESQTKSPVNICVCIDKQVNQTVEDFQQQSYPPGQEDLLDYLL